MQNILRKKSYFIVKKRKIKKKKNASKLFIVENVFNIRVLSNAKNKNVSLIQYLSFNLIKSWMV